MQRHSEVMCEHDTDIGEPLTRCRACGRMIGNSYAVRVSHGRTHVRKEQSVEGGDDRGHITFYLPENQTLARVTR